MTDVLYAAKVLFKDVTVIPRIIIVIPAADAVLFTIVIHVTFVDVEAGTV